MRRNRARTTRRLRDLVFVLLRLSGRHCRRDLAAHPIDTRDFLVMRLGSPLANPIARYHEDARSIADIREWPTLDEIRKAWLAVSSHLQSVLEGLSAEQVCEPNVHRFPLGDTSRLGMIVFLAQHDSYHLDQIAFLRRQLGKTARSYARGAAGLT